MTGYRSCFLHSSTLGHFQTVGVLLACGADPLIPNKNEETPKALGEAHSTPEIVNLFKIYSRFGIVGLVTLCPLVSDLKKQVVGIQLSKERTERERFLKAPTKKPEKKAEEETLVKLPYSRTPDRTQFVNNLFEKMVDAVEGVNPRDVEVSK